MDDMQLVRASVRHMYWMVLWAWFMVFHLMLATAFLLWVWAANMQPLPMAQAVLTMAASLPVLILSLCGLSLATLGALYVRLWKNIFQRTSEPMAFLR